MPNLFSRSARAADFPKAVRRRYGTERLFQALMFRPLRTI
jgi:hypothetical protein